jgi:AcrR family transcriptional regulator
MLSTSTSLGKVLSMTEAPVQRRYHHGDLRAALLDAAERRVRTHGVGELSLRDLAREVGVSHAAPRRHFPERQDLLDALAELGYARLGERVGAAVADEEAEFAARVRRAASAFAHFATENAALLELMNATKHRQDASDVPRSAAAAYAPLLDLIRQGVAEGVLGDAEPEEIGLILYATMNGITTLVNSGAVEAERLDDLTVTAVDQFLKGAS